MDFKSFKISPHQVPIVYSPHYNFTLYGLENLHPFDAKKYGRIHDYLIEKKLLTQEQFVTPGQPSREDLLLAHSQRYLKTLSYPWVVAGYTELAFVNLIPPPIIKRKILNPMLYATGGTVLAAHLALVKGWAINLGGGFHHAWKEEGGGFCVYADIALAVKYLRKHHPRIKSFMIIDLDAHQGNGVERDFMGDKEVFILDMYNAYIYPLDEEAKAGMALGVELEPGTGDEVYLARLKQALTTAFSRFNPDIIFYNAGTDVLQKDPLGFLNLSPDGVIQRDERVFREALTRRIPIVMLLSGGYQKNNYEIVGRSILNLEDKLRLLKK